MGYFGGIGSFEPEEWLRNALSQLTLDVEMGEKLKKLACIGTIHRSLKRHFPFHELEEDLEAMTYMKQAYVGFNETKKRMVKLTVSLTYDPDDIPRLWRLKDRAERYRKSGIDRKKDAGERLFEGL